MQYTVTRNEIQVLGHIWMPNVQCAMTYTLDSYDTENARDEDGEFTTDSVEHWLMLNSGDFQTIDDWNADFGDGEFTKDWNSEDSEMTFYDCCFGDDES